MRRGPKPTEGLTPAQERLIRALSSHLNTHGIPPTVQEVATSLGVTGATVHEHIIKLKAKGVLRHEPKKARSLQLLEKKTEACRVTAVQPISTKTTQAIPMFSSHIPAGFPSPADDYIESQLDLNQHLIEHPAATFFVRVEGNSMVDAGIHHGNILIVDRSLEAQNGDIVVAVVHGELTVKRLQKNKGAVYLKPENPDYTPLKITEEMELTLWGVVTSSVQEFRKR
ncbi:MAG: repressor LexA [Magnetococcales bacterium]|nr:repressor LexA [Magnetococcales bacterium]